MFQKNLCRTYSLLFLLLPFFVFAQTNCESIPSRFSSYNQAITSVRSAKFRISESVNTSSSSVITSANFYSCDAEKGFLIIGINNRPYIHTGIPKKLWQAFKQASSFGSFYNTYIRNKYRVAIN